MRTHRPSRCMASHAGPQGPSSMGCPRLTAVSACSYGSVSVCAWRVGSNSKKWFISEGDN